MGIFIIISEFIYNNYFCFSGKYNDKCFFLEFRNAIWEPIFYFFISLSIISVFLFLVQDSVFNKWIKFAIGYVIIAWIIILSVPVRIHSLSPITIERYNVSIWMSSLFLVISLILLAIWQFKEKKSSK